MAQIIVLPFLTCVLQLVESTSTPANVLKRDTSCNVSSAWQPTYSAYSSEDVDVQLRSWWQQANTTQERFDHAFGQELGNNNFWCGVDLDDTCNIPDCFDVQNNDDQPWLYLAGVAVVNLNSMFDAIWNGVSLGQNDAEDLTNDLADRIFKWQDPIYAESEVATWLGAIVPLIVSYIVPEMLPVADELDVLKIAGLEAISLFANAGLQQIAASLEPNAGTNREVGIDTLDDLFYSMSLIARSSMEAWANNTFAGLQDVNNHTIIDYLSKGGFIENSVIPTPTATAEYFKALLISKAINGLWRNQTIYVVSTTGDLNDTSYPSNAAWYSSEANQTFVLYHFDTKSQRPQEPPGMDALNGSFYSITASQIAQSSGRAWLTAGNNYTSAIATQRIQDSFTSNGTLTPFQDGAGWEGVFDLPVCDVQEHANWVVPYGGKTLPCCCGPNCQDTYDFVQKANLHKSLDWVDICRSQLRAEEIDVNSVDFGIDGGSKAKQFWHRLGKGGKAGFITGVVVASLIVLVICCS